MPRRELPTTHTRITADHERKLKRRVSAQTLGFDPNADPVVIGEDAYDVDPTVGYNVAIGRQATTGGGPGPVYDATAVGAGASANDEESTAIGGDAGTSAPGATAVGCFAQASATSSVAIGYGADTQAGADDAVAIGHNADNAWSHSTALGADSACDRANQVMLGSDADVPEIPGLGNGLVVSSPDGTRWLITVDNTGHLTTTDVGP